MYDLRLFVDLHELYDSSRTSVDMDGTLKIGNYKVGGTQKPLNFTETQYFF